jgi:hypothetical protein
MLASQNSVDVNQEMWGERSLVIVLSYVLYDVVEMQIRS